MDGLHTFLGLLHFFVVACRIIFNWMQGGNIGYRWYRPNGARTGTRLRSIPRTYIHQRAGILHIGSYWYAQPSPVRIPSSFGHDENTSEREIDLWLVYVLALSMTLW